MTTEEKIAVMQAYVDGKEIESCVTGGEWEVNKYPAWTWGTCEYRVKQLPEFKIDRDKFNRISTILQNDYDFNSLEVLALIVEVGYVFGVTIKVE